MRRGRGFPLPVLRVFVLAAFGVVACIWALRRAYRPKPPMVVPVPAERAPADEIVAPELIPTADAAK